MTGAAFLIVFVAAVVLMLLMISRWKIHPFLSIMLVALVLALLAGIPMPQVPKVIGEGFASTFTSIGIVIILGALIGAILEQTGAALTLADAVIRLVGEKRPGLALELMGWIVSIPVFCDSGFVILNPIRKALVKRTGAPSVTLTVCLACGLYIAHVFIPPTPGPIAAAQTLGIGEDLLLLMGLGVVTSVFPLTAGYLYARFIGRRIKASDDNSEQTAESYEALKAGFGQLPGLAFSLAPLVVPIVLMALSSIAAMLHWSGWAGDLCLFVGHPMIALAVGALLAVLLLAKSGKSTELFRLTDETLRTVGPILFVTAAGSVLGRVIAASGLMEYITEEAPVLQTLGVVFPFLVAALFKSAQGSSTVAITTTAGLIAPLLPALGLESSAEISLAVLAIGAGAMTVSHANDSYFWVVTRFGGLSVKDGYRSQTLATLVMGLAAITGICLLRLILH
ncbi:MAG: GntP family permease [Bacteroidales bacterium]|jgi:GntP family gluconate:H+ symporter|nr:GntP family permease [Bacteroidales bacterium]